MRILRVKTWPKLRLVHSYHLDGFDACFGRFCVSYPVWHFTDESSRYCQSRLRD